MIRAFLRRGGIRLRLHGNCGQLGKQDNCQVAVTRSLATIMRACRRPIGSIYQGVGDGRARRRKAGVPKEITFKTKPAIALDHLRWAVRWACRAAWSEWTPAMAPTPLCLGVLPNWA
ncbi:transposase [Bradyrhizobium sp. BRP22]|nr:transposase [Bradyrhizobium sp. BRP22]